MGSSCRVLANSTATGVHRRPMTIISDTFGFVFVKTTKTAGTSVEIELAKLVEPAAIVTPIVPAEPGHEPRNYSRGRFAKPFYNHMPASLIARYLGGQNFASKFSFCVERDPITKCISHFHMLANSPHHAGGEAVSTWADYVDRGQFPIDTDKYVDVVAGRKRLIVDEVIPYESLAECLSRIGVRLGMGPIVVNARAKSEYSRARRVTVADVSASQRRVIMRAFEESLHFSGLEALVRFGNARFGNARFGSENSVLSTVSNAPPTNALPTGDRSRIFVLIPTIGRAGCVANVVRWLERQTRRVDGIVVVGVSSSDIAGVGEGATIAVETALWDKGLTRQRNHGLDLVSGRADIVLFVDDDFVPSRTYIAELEKAFDRGADIAGITGRVIQDGVKGSAISFDEALTLVDADVVPPKLVVEDKQGLYGCNMAFRMASIEGLRFDERLPLYGWQEDVDFAFRVSRRGRVVRMNTMAGVHMGVKGARTSGKRLGYSQIANPMYLLRKQTIRRGLAYRIMWRNVATNLLRSFYPEHNVDRRGPCSRQHSRFFRHCARADRSRAGTGTLKFRAASRYSFTRCGVPGAVICCPGSKRRRDTSPSTNPLMANCRTRFYAGAPSKPMPRAMSSSAIPLQKQIILRCSIGSTQKRTVRCGGSAARACPSPIPTMA